MHGKPNLKISGHVATVANAAVANIPKFIFHQDGSPSHFHFEVRQVPEHSVTRTVVRACVWK
jgi:hypothetical protein